MSELRDQHKAFAEWFLQQNPVAPNAEDLAWAAWKAALAQPELEPPRDEWRLASEPPDTPPHDYLLKKLAMVMPLFEEARDALTAISEQQRAVRCISPRTQLSAGGILRDSPPKTMPRRLISWLMQ